MDEGKIDLQEKHKHDRTDHQARKEEINSKSHLREHLCRKSCNQEVPKPVAACSEGLTERSNVLGKHFAVVDPRCTVPAGCVTDRPKIEECHCRNTP